MEMYIVMALICAGISFAIASSKNLADPFLWTVVGGLLGVIGVIIVACQKTRG